MTQQRKRLSGLEKIGIVKRYLIDRVVILDLCDEYQLRHSQIYRSQAVKFEHSEATAAERRNVLTPLQPSSEPTSEQIRRPPVCPRVSLTMASSTAGSQLTENSGTPTISGCPPRARCPYPVASRSRIVTQRYDRSAA